MGSDPYFLLLFGSLLFTVFFGLWYAVRVAMGLTDHAVNARQPHMDIAGSGLMTSFNGLMVVFSSPTTRVAAFLQAILSNTTIPFTIICRWLLLNEKLNLLQGVCALAVVGGILIALIPTFTDTDSDPTKGHVTGIAKILWPLCFTVGFLPAAAQVVFQERGLKHRTQSVNKATFDATAGSRRTSAGRVSMSYAAVGSSLMAAQDDLDDVAGNDYGDEEPPPADTEGTALLKDAESGGSGGADKHSSKGTMGVVSGGKFASGSTAKTLITVGGTVKRSRPVVDVIYFMFWLNLYQFLGNAALFWSDIIPGFGMASEGITQLGHRLSFGLRCSFGNEPVCTSGGVPAKMILFVATYCMGGLGSALLSRHQEGATLVALVNTLSTPLAAVFWTLFRAQPFGWHPEWLATTWYSVAGLGIMIPGIVLYNFYSDKKPAAH